MKFRYSIARYMPSLVRGEVLNLGVILEDEQGRVAASFLSRISHVRAIYPDADVATLRLVRDHFSKRLPPPSGQGVLFAEEGAPSLDELVRSYQNVLSLTEPRVTMGTSLTHELEDLYLRFVAPVRSLTPKPVSAVQVAPSKFRRRVESWLTKSSLFGPNAYQRNFEVPGSVYPWTFDFGLQNGKTTIIQTISLKAPLDVAMNRAALVGARIADAKQARSGTNLGGMEAVAVPDSAEPYQEPVKYLEQHDVEVIPFSKSDFLRSRLEEPLSAHRR